jgi:ribosomal protein S18 acetylase RimI-like enzyme
MPPGKNMDGLLTVLRSGMWRLKYQLSREGRERFFNEFLPVLHDTKEAVLGKRDADSWYLVYLGTRPEARGNGYARKLVEYVTKKADADCRPCYLESSSAVNVKIYEKLGFGVREKLYLTRGGKNIQLDIMVREPVA